MGQQDTGEPSAVQGALFFGLAALGVWLLITEAPISIYLAVSLTFFLVFRSIAKAFDEDRSIKQRIAKVFFEDSCKIARNVAIGASFVLVIQIALNMFWSSTNPNVIGTLEQRIWDAIAWLKPVVSFKATVAIVAGALVLSVLLRNHLPSFLVSKFRKLVGTVLAFFGSVAIFTFVTADSAEANFERATQPLRAKLAYSLVETAKAREEAAAYRWIYQTVEEAEIEAPETIISAQEYFREGERICDEYEEVYGEGVLVYRESPLRRRRVFEGMGEASSSELWPFIQGTSAAEASPMIDLLVKARQWWARLSEGELTITDLARDEGISSSWLSRVVRLNFLAPELVDDILAGSQPAGMNAGAVEKATGL